MSKYKVSVIKYWKMITTAGLYELFEGGGFVLTPMA